MRKVLYTSVLILITLLTQAQPVSYKRNYTPDSTAFATAFTELHTLEFIIGYTENLFGNTNNVNLHLLKTDRDGNRLWDRIIKQYQTDDSTAQFSIQSITELKNGTLVLDMVYPYGERYVMKFDADGNKLWESYLHNTFADYFVYDRQVRERSSTMALEDNRVLVCGASFSTLNPRATLSVIAPDGAPRDYYYYRGFFNASYFVSDDHVYTTGIELTDSNESLVLSDIKQMAIFITMCASVTNGLKPYAAPPCYSLTTPCAWVRSSAKATRLFMRTFTNTISTAHRSPNASPNSHAAPTTVTIAERDPACAGQQMQQLCRGTN